MMFKKKLLVSAMATAMVAGAALSGSAQAVRISETGAGQVLMAPMYLAGPLGYNTKIVVVNSSQTDAVKAKLVMRSMGHSDECRDVILYLSPSDVFRGEIKDVNGTPTLESDDDSIISSVSGSTPTFGSQTKYSYPLAAPTTSATDTCAVGHIEVIGAYAARGAITTPSGVVNVVRGMSKFDLVKIFGLPNSPVSRASLTPAASVATDAIAASMQSSVHPSLVQLSGTTEIYKANDRLMEKMVALREGVNSTTAGASTLVVANTSFDTNVGAQTQIGQSFGALGADNTTDIEGALAASNLYGSYEKDAVTGRYTNLVVTYPTRYRHHAVNSLVYTPPFRTDGSVQFSITSHDNMENARQAVGCFQSPCGTTSSTYMTNEVNYIDLTNPTISQSLDYTSGWYRVDFTPVAGAAYTGMPAIGFSHRYLSGMVQSYVESLNRP